PFPGEGIGLANHVMTHVLAKLDEATRTGQFNQTFRILCTHGEERWVHLRGFPVRNPDGKIFAWLAPRKKLRNRSTRKIKSSKTWQLLKRRERKPTHCARQLWR